MQGITGSLDLAGDWLGHGSIVRENKEGRKLMTKNVSYCR